MCEPGESATYADKKIFQLENSHSAASLLASPHQQRVLDKTERRREQNGAELCYILLCVMVLIRLPPGSRRAHTAPPVSRPSLTHTVALCSLHSLPVQTVADLGELRWHTKQRVLLGLLAEVIVGEAMCDKSVPYKENSGS